MEVAREFLLENLPMYSIQPAAGDGSCILHAFQEGLHHIGRNYTLTQVKESLREEITKKKAFFSKTTLLVMLM